MRFDWCLPGLARVSPSPGKTVFFRLGGAIVRRGIIDHIHSGALAGARRSPTPPGNRFIRAFDPAQTDSRACGATRP
jgi:hypothetical protein